LKKYKAKTNPLTVGAILADVNRLQIDRFKVVNPILTEIDRVVKRILNEEGLIGCSRLTYHDFARELFGLIRNKPEVAWNAFKEGSILSYTKGYRADPKLLERIAGEVFALVKDWLEKMSGGGVGGTET